VIVVRMRLFTSERRRLIDWYRWWLGCLGGLVCLCVCVRTRAEGRGARRGGSFPGRWGGCLVYSLPFKSQTLTELQPPPD